MAAFDNSESFRFPMNALAYSLARRELWLSTTSSMQEDSVRCPGTASSGPCPMTHCFGRLRSILRSLVQVRRERARPVAVDASLKTVLLMSLWTRRPDSPRPLWSMIVRSRSRHRGRESERRFHSLCERLVLGRRCQLDPQSPRTTASRRLRRCCQATLRRRYRSQVGTHILAIPFVPNENGTIMEAAISWRW